MSVKELGPTGQIQDVFSIKDKRSNESSADRDPNGQHQKQDQGKKEYTEEDVLEAIENLKNLEGIKKNNLTVKYEKNGYVYVVYVTDVTGKVVRRIPQQDLMLYLDQDDSKPSGHIINKAM
tara:strand:- start:3083 stop:3445 length:363 start_codon:yes stop_codon:yes gene_type:complete